MLLLFRHTVMRFFRLLNLAWTGRGSLAVALGLVALGQAAGAAAKRPNILFIMADDLGWMDLACQGNKLVETPNIDRLARQGMRFTSAYAAAPVCSPTRATLLTGKYPQRIGFTSWLNPRKPNGPNSAATYIPAAEITIGEAFQQAGYRTGYIGKWHVGSEKIGMPQTARLRLADSHRQAWLARVLFPSL